METNNDSRFIIGSVILGDLLFLNLLLCVLVSIGYMPFGENLAQHCVIASLCYVVSILTLGGVKLYRRRVRADQIITIVFGNIVGFFVVWLAILAILDINVSLSKGYIIYAISIFFAISEFRLVYQSILRGMRSRGHHTCNVVFVGSTRNMDELYEEMALDAKTGYNVVGYFDVKPNPNFKAKYLGDCDQVTEYIDIHAGKVQRLYCSLPSAMKNTILPIITSCEKHLVRFYSVPNLRNYLSRRVNLEVFSNTPVLSIRTEPLTKFDNRLIKRTFDILFSGLFLCTLFPIIFIIFGTLIKLSSRGPIFFKQKRHGLDGKEFWCYKFRSMKVNADSDTVQATEHDPRKTKVGDFMRKTNVDEFPQFFNVFIGNMTIVGPRPHMVQHTNEYSELINSYMVRHLVKPGVTGWAQVTGFRGETKELSDMEGRIKADIWYMEHWTFTLDLYIIYKTVANVVGRKDSKAF